MRYDEKKLTAGQKPSAQQSYVQQAGGAAGAAFQRARANQGLPSAQQSYVQQAGAAAGSAFQQEWAREMRNRQQPAATGALQLNVGEMRNALQNGQSGNWRSANGQNSPAQAGYVSQNADRMNDLRTQMGDLADQYANRGPFQVNLANDALYRQYAQQYAQMGQRAMQDTMGQAAGLTGGYGSSYAQNVGQQAYNQQLQGLNDAALSIYDRAKARWDSEGDAMLRQLDLLGNQYERERAADTEAYSRWRDQVGDERYAEERDYNRNWEKMKWDYGVSQDALNNEWREREWNRTGDWHDQDFAHTLAREQVQDSQWDRTFAYNAQQDALSNDWREREFSYNAQQDALNNDWREREFGRQGLWHDQEFNYNAGRDTRGDGWQQAMTWLKAGIVPDASVLQAAGISAADAQRLASYYSFANAGSYGGSSSGGRSSGRRSSSGGTPPRTPPRTPPTAEQVAAAAAPAAINGALAGVYVANNAGAGDKIGSDSWVDTQAKWYARLVNNHKDPQEVYDAIVGEYTQANGKLNPADITRLWGMIQKRVANAGYIRGNRNAYEGEMP